MSVRRNSRSHWFYRRRVKKTDGTRVEITGTPARNTRLAAEAAERAHIDRVLNPPAVPVHKEVPTFAEWFKGRFWREWVIGRKNKPSEVEAKDSIFDQHLAPAFGKKPLDEIRPGDINAFVASLVERSRPLSEKRINNVLAVLSKALRYAEEVELVDRAPRIRLFRVERPEITSWSFEEYARVLEAAMGEGPEWYAAACLAGEAGLRVGEVKALRWREDVDLVAGTLTVNRQIRHKVMGTPKGRTRRTVPMTGTLLEALKSLSVVREGFVIRETDGSAVNDLKALRAMFRICRRAGLPERGWHTLRHTFGTHAAMFGVNPWRLQAWMGHKRIDETMLYVNVAGSHMRPLPAEVLRVQEIDPDRRILAMLSARRCIHVASGTGQNEKAVGI